MKFIDTLFWEFIKDAPVIVLFIIAVWLWARTRKASAVACALCGAVIRSLLIRFVGSATNRHCDALAVTAVNVVSMGLLQVLLVAYLGTEANWSNEKTDLFVGAMTGVSLAVAQGPAWQGWPRVDLIGRGIPLAVMGGLVLLGIRRLKNQRLASVLANGSLLALATTFLVSAVDYGYVLGG